jgi:octaprenyl-diphosphate synthase
MKTGELFAVSCELGGWLSGAQMQERRALRDFGLNLGTAYQIYDDCLDIFGSESAVGKSLGTDLINGKLTLPVLIALEKGKGDIAPRLRTLLESWTSDKSHETLQLLAEEDALGESRTVIHHFLAAAVNVLDALPRTSARGPLKDLCEFLAQQTLDLGV